MTTLSRHRRALAEPSRATRATVAAAAVTMLLAACAPGGGPTPSPTGTASPSSPAATPAPSETAAPPAPSPTPSAERLSCAGVLDPDSIAGFEAMGFSQIEDFADRMVEQNVSIALFALNSGVLCQWGVPATGSVENYGLSAITTAQAETEKTRLREEGYASESRPEGELLTGRDSAGNAQVYLFSPGHWYYGFTLDRVLEIRANAGLE